MSLQTEPLEQLFPVDRMYRNKAYRCFKTACRVFEESDVIVYRNVQMWQDAFFGQACYIRENAAIDSGAFLGPEVYAGEGACLSKDCIVAPYVKIAPERWLGGGPWIWLASPPAVQINSRTEIWIYSPEKACINSEMIPFRLVEERWEQICEYLSERERRLGKEALRFFRHWVKNNIRFLTREEKEKIELWKGKAKILK